MRLARQHCTDRAFEARRNSWRMLTAGSDSGSTSPPSGSDRNDMWRRVGWIATALSLAVCGAALALGVRSHFVCDSAAWRAHGGDPWNQVVSSRGRIELQRWKPDLECGFSSSQCGVSLSHYPVDRWDVRSPSVCGFGWRRSEDSLHLAVPHYAVALGGVPLPLGSAVRRKRRHRQERRRRTGLCLSCGYDIRATPEQCPECGTVAPAPQQNPPVAETVGGPGRP